MWKAEYLKWVGTVKTDQKKNTINVNYVTYVLPIKTAKTMERILKC